MSAARILERAYPACSLISVGGDCLVWSGAVQSSGYGSIGNGAGSSSLTHRVVWEDANGPIPDGLTIDHLCRTKLCVNVAHMELVTRGENTRRALALRTHCKDGHLLSGDNVRLVKRSRTGRTHRVCVACQRRNARASWHRLHGKGMAA